MAGCFSELLNGEAIDADNMEAEETFPLYDNEELALLSREVVGKALQDMRNNKAPGVENLPEEVLK